MAAACAAEGASVVLNGRNKQRVDDAVERFRASETGSEVSGVTANFTDPQQVQALLDTLRTVDVLVNNVGLYDLTPFAEIQDDDWMRYFEVNVMSGVRLSRHLLDPMLHKGWGRIIFIGTESAVDVPPEMIHYGATKATALALSNGQAKLYSRYLPAISSN